MKRILAWLFVGALVVANPATLVAKEKKLEVLFRLADLNSDGKLSAREFAAMRTAEEEDRAWPSFKKLDRNNDGRLTFEEFKYGHECH